MKLNTLDKSKKDRAGTYHGDEKQRKKGRVNKLTTRDTANLQNVSWRKRHHQGLGRSLRPKAPVQQ